MSAYQRRPRRDEDDDYRPNTKRKQNRGGKMRWAKRNEISPLPFADDDFDESGLLNDDDFVSSDEDDWDYDDEEDEDRN